MSNSLWPHRLQHARLPCPSLSPRVCSNPCPLSRWCHPTISSSVAPFYSCPQSFPSSGSFPMSRLFATIPLCLHYFFYSYLFSLEIHLSDLYSTVFGIWLLWLVKVLVAQSCSTLCNPRDCSLPGSSVHGIFQARILEWVAILFCRGSSQPRNWNCTSPIAGRFFTIWATT